MTCAEEAPHHAKFVQRDTAAASMKNNSEQNLSCRHSFILEEATLPTSQLGKDYDHSITLQKHAKKSIIDK